MLGMRPGAAILFSCLSSNYFENVFLTCLST